MNDQISASQKMLEKIGNLLFVQSDSWHFHIFVFLPVSGIFC
jgi:hypothetical protein